MRKSNNEERYTGKPLLGTVRNKKAYTIYFVSSTQFRVTGDDLLLDFKTYEEAFNFVLEQ
jgi:hypothetical protein